MNSFADIDYLLLSKESPSSKEAPYKMYLYILYIFVNFSLDRYIDSNALMQNAVFLYK